MIIQESSDLQAIFIEEGVSGLYQKTERGRYLLWKLSAIKYNIAMTAFLIIIDLPLAKKTIKVMETLITLLYLIVATRNSNRVLYAPYSTSNLCILHLPLHLQGSISHNIN